MRKSLSPKAILTIAGAALIGAVSPGIAQPADEELVVTGRYGKLPDSAQSASQPVTRPALNWRKTSLPACFGADQRLELVRHATVLFGRRVVGSTLKREDVRIDLAVAGSV